MTNQTIFEMLANLEEMTFYHDLKTQSKETLAIHETAKQVLEAFAKMTGCHNTDPNDLPDFNSPEAFFCEPD